MQYAKRTALTRSTLYTLSMHSENESLATESCRVTRRHVAKSEISDEIRLVFNPNPNVNNSTLLFSPESDAATEKRFTHLKHT